MAMRALLSKLRIPAAASCQTLPPSRSFSIASEDKFRSTTWRATAEEGSPLSYERLVLKRIFAREKRYARYMLWGQVICNFISFNAIVYIFRLSRKSPPDKLE